MAIGVTRKNPIEKKSKEEIKQLKKKGWVIPYGFMDFTKPVTYNEACREGADLQNRIANIEEEKNNG